MHNDTTAGITGLTAEALAELEGMLAAEGVEGNAAQAIARRDPSRPTPATFSQELLWMLDRATPNLTAYNLPMARRVRGTLDVDALERALTSVAARHEALRTRFADGERHPVQIVDAPAPVVVRRVDLSDVPADEREATAKRDVTARVRTPIDLAHEASFRVTLLRLAEDDHVLLIETHHIVADGWSMGIVFRELAEAYRATRAGRKPALGEPPLQLGDVAAWERERLSGARLDELLAFWREQIGTAADEPLSLPTDFPRSPTPTFTGARESVMLTSEELAAIKRLGQTQHATLYMTLLAAFATVLHRYTDRANVLVGSGSAGRSQHETEGIVGYINGTLVQRADFSGDPTFAQLLARVRQSAVDAYDHQDIPLEKLALELRRGQDQLSHAPLFEVVLTMQDTVGGSLSLEGLTIEPFGMDFGATKFDVTLLVTERDDQLWLTLAYRSELFAPATMRRLLGHIVSVLHAGIDDASVRISRLPLLTDSERADLARWNDTATDEGRPATLVGLIEAQAARVPSQPAVVETNGTVLTYEQLNQRANQLARHLGSLGVASGATVGLLIDRSADAIVALLGILKAGAAYVPLPPDVPAARRAEQMLASGVSALVTLSGQSEGLPQGVPVVSLDGDAAILALLPATDLPPAADPASLAYVLFTSGSTGVPKGVAVTHANVVHYARAISRVLTDMPSGTAGDGFASMDGWRIGMASTLGADLGGTSLWSALLSGAALHVLGKDVATEPARYADYVGSQPLDLLKLTPSHLQALVAGRTGAELRALLPRRWIVLGGEALRPELARLLVEAGRCRVLNHYGPTETTVGVLTHEATADSLDAADAQGAQSVPLGLPLANTRAYVIDANGSEPPVGIPGELWIGGAGVATGYLNRDALTAERFTVLGGDRVYRTGDRVRRLADGTLEFLGRTDDQVKVRGFRVELGEVEGRLRAHPGVASAIVVQPAGPDATVAPSLVAYVVPRSAGYAVSHADRPTSEALREWVGASLPQYMVPEAVVLLESMPLTPNGKVDRRALPVPGAVTAAPAQVAPRTETETQLAAIWSDVLKKERVGVTENFLDLGGHSLLAIRVLGRVSKAFGVRLSLRALFEMPTVAQLALHLDTERRLAALEAMSDDEAERLLANEENRDG